MLYDFHYGLLRLNNINYRVDFFARFPLQKVFAKIVWLQKMCKLQITIVMYNYLIEFNKSHLYFKLNYILMLRAIFMISIILSITIVMLPLTNNNVFAGKEKPQLFSPYLSKILGAKWWQWALEIPTPINPLVDANPCNVNQHGYFFFIGGVFTVTDTSGTSESSNVFQTRNAGHSSDTSVSSDTNDHIERTCTIPKGKAIFFPVYNAIQTFGPEPSGPPATVQEAIQIVKESVNQATNLKASVDGTNIKVDSKLRSLTRIFEFTLPENNLFGTDVLGPYTAISDGYWVALKPLKVGNHEISISANHPSGNIDITYHIKVQ